MIIYNTKDAEITYDLNNYILQQTINDLLNQNSLREFQTEFIKINKVLKVPKIILNVKEQRVFNDEDVKWMKHFMIPTMYKSRVKYLAIVVPENIFGKLAMFSFANAAKEITVNLFEDLHSAKEWIITI